MTEQVAETTRPGDKMTWQEDKTARQIGKMTEQVDKTTQQGNKTTWEVDKMTQQIGKWHDNQQGDRTSRQDNTTVRQMTWQIS